MRRHSRIVIAVMVAGVAGSAAAAGAQTQAAIRDVTQRSLEELLALEVVSAASRYEQHISEAPASVSIVTADDIARAGYRTLADVLQSVRGIVVTSDRNYSYLGVRAYGQPGDYNSRILVMIDGHRLNDNMYGSVGIEDSFGLDLSLVERIEIVRGPGSSLYGTNAVLGVINVVTKRLEDSRGFRLGLDQSSFATTRLRIAYARMNGASSGLMIAGSTGFGAGQDLYYPEFDAPETNNGIAAGVDDEQFARVFVRAVSGNWSVQSLFASREKGVPTASFGTIFNDARTRTTDKRWYGELRYRRMSRGGPLFGRLSLDGALYEGTYAYAAERKGETALLDEFGHSTWLSAEIQRSTMIGEGHLLTVGSELRVDFEQHQGNALGPTVYLNDHRSSAFGALFIQDAYRLTKWLRLQAGVRHDRYRTFGNATTPRLAVMAQPSDRTTLKFLYGRAFRAPTPFELGWGHGGRRVRQRSEPHDPAETAAARSPVQHPQLVQPPVRRPGVARARAAGDSSRRPHVARGPEHEILKCREDPSRQPSRSL